MGKSIRVSLFATSAMIALCAASWGQVIRLEKQVTVEPRQDVRLGDVAKVSGVDRRTGEELSNTMIVSNIESSRTIKAESVLLALMSQGGGGGGEKFAGSLQISGSAQCSVLVADGRHANAGTGFDPTAQIAAKAVDMDTNGIPPARMDVAPLNQGANTTASTQSASNAAGENLTLSKVITARV